MRRSLAGRAVSFLLLRDRRGRPSRADRAVIADVSKPSRCAPGWPIGLVLALLQYAHQVERALTAPIQRFDEGIQLAASTFLGHGLLAGRDYYMPYGNGLSLVGLPARWFFHDSLLVSRLTYGIAPALVTMLVFLAVAKRRGCVAGTIAATLTLLAGVSTYSMAWVAVAGFVVLIDRAADTAAGAGLTSLIADHPRQVLIASSILGLAAWPRPEYAILIVIWCGFLWRAAPHHRPSWWLLAVPIVVASAPALLVVTTGGAHGFWEWASYSVGGGFRTYRQLPIHWGFPSSFVDGLLHGHFPRDDAGLVISYLAGLSVVVLWAVQLLRPGRRILERDPTMLAPFLAVASAIVLYGMSVRFSAPQGIHALPLFWLAVFLAPWRPRALQIGPSVLALALALPLLSSLPSEVGHLPTALRHPPLTAEPLARLQRIPVNVEEQASFAVLLHAWEDQGLRGRPVFSVNIRNDQAGGNEVFVYWLLDATPAAWPTTFDPGLADRADIQREVIDRLCRNRAPVVQHTAAYGAAELPRSDHRSRLLDQFLALNYRVDARMPLYRLLTRDTTRCLDPRTVDDSVILARRDSLVEQDDPSRAGALATLRIERALHANRHASSDDVALAILGGYWIPDELIPRGPIGTGLLELRDSAPRPHLLDAVTAGGTPAVRLANLVAYTQHRPEHPAPGDLEQVATAARRLVDDRPRWPAALQVLLSYQPGNAAFYDQLLARAGPSIDVESARLAWAIGAHDQHLTITSGLALTKLLADDPVRHGAVLLQLADSFDRDGERACADELRRRADALPGVVARVRRFGSGSCARAVLPR